MQLILCTPVISSTYSVTYSIKLILMAYSWKAWINQPVLYSGWIQALCDEMATCDSENPTRAKALSCNFPKQAGLRKKVWQIIQIFDNQWSESQGRVASSFDHSLPGVFQAPCERHSKNPPLWNCLIFTANLNFDCSAYFSQVYW